MIGHRSKVCCDIVAEVTAGLKEMFGTTGDLFILTSSGTGAMEAAVVNFLSPGDEALVMAAGKFGERFGHIARAYGANVTQIDIPYGQAIPPERVAEELAANPRFKAVFVTHNETSTGVTNDLEAIGSVVRNHAALLIVDSISGAGALPLKMDDWGLDVVVSGSQKGWMIPPGLAFIAANERAWAAHAESTMPRFYFDLTAARKSAAKNTTPFTPAVGLLFGLQEALRLMREEGFENIIERHRRLGQYTRDGIHALGLRLFADEAHASNSVTAVLSPEGVNAEDIRARLLNEYDILVAGGQGELKGRIFRIGHLGWVHTQEIDEVLRALAQVIG
jgi:aspartate aminotransferase-like enzyme